MSEEEKSTPKQYIGRIIVPGNESPTSKVVFLFAENMGAVHELSKVTGSLEHRLDDLERSHETVAVRLSRLKRGGSIISNLSSSSGSSASACEKIRHGNINLYQELLQRAIRIAEKKTFTVWDGNLFRMFCNIFS